MGWGARFGAAWQGKVSGADLGALFATTARLGDLQQALADRRLNAEIAQASQASQPLSAPPTIASQRGQGDTAGQTDRAWRIQLELGPLAAPLWLADALVGLAQAFYDAETQGQPDQHDPNHPPFVSPYAHDLIAALLAPVEDIIADVTVALADPNHRSGLTAPLHVGPRADIAGYDLPRPPSVAYAAGLAKASRRVHTSAATLLLEAQTALPKSSPPDWLMTGFQRLNGALQGAGARLDMIETRMGPLVAPPGRSGAAHEADPAALTTICDDLWTIADTALVAGQQISDPHLLPESPPVVAPRAPAAAPTRAAPRPTAIRAAGPQGATTRQPRQTPPAPHYRPIAPGIPPDPLPPAPPQPLQPPDRALPQIAEGAPSLPTQARMATASTLSPEHAPEHTSVAVSAPDPIVPPLPGFAFPSVGGAPGVTSDQAGAAPHPASSHPIGPTSLPTVGPSSAPTGSALPDVSEPSRSTPAEAPTSAADKTTKQPQPQTPAPQRPATSKATADDDGHSLFPKIG